METANTPQNNSTVEVEPFTFFFPLTEKIILDSQVKVAEIGSLKVQGFAYRAPNALGEPVITVDVQWVKHVGVDVKVVLTHFGVLDTVKEAAQRHAERVVFAPKPTKESVLKAIKDTVYDLREWEPLSFPTIPVRLSDGDHDVVHVEGLVLTTGEQLIVLDGSGNGHPLELGDVNAEKMIAGLYKGLAKRFPNKIKPIQ